MSVNSQKNQRQASNQYIVDKLADAQIKKAVAEVEKLAQKRSKWFDAKNWRSV